MSTTYTHTRLSIVDAAGNVNVLYPSTTGSDVTVSQANNTILATKGITTVQGLADALRSSAFSDTIDPSSLIDDTAGDGDTSVTWSADKITDALAQVSGNIPPSITVDSALSSSSSNPVENRVITDALQNIDVGGSGTNNILYTIMDNDLYITYDSSIAGNTACVYNASTGTLNINSDTDETTITTTYDVTGDALDISTSSLLYTVSGSDLVITTT